MPYVVDVEEPWIGPGYSTYDFGGLDGARLETALREFRQDTAKRGGTIVYEGDPANRPQWLKEAFAKAKAERAK